MAEYTGVELELFQHATNWKKYFSSSIHSCIKGNVLEVGAGLGANARFLMTNQVKSWTFLEPDEKLAVKISDSASDLKIPKRIIQGTIESVLSEKFNTVIYIDVLEHIENSRGEIVNVRKVMDNGGYLIILVPAFQFLFNEFDARLGHFRRYNKALLRSEINSTLEEKKMFYLDTAGFLASMANRLFLKKAEIRLSQVRFWDRVLVPSSGILDPVLFHAFGKSLVGVFQKKP